MLINSSICLFVIDHCRYNLTAVAACGMENECIGSYSSWRCICKGPKYMQHPTDIQACMEGKKILLYNLFSKKNIPREG